MIGRLFLVVVFLLMGCGMGHDKFFPATAESFRDKFIFEFDYNKMAWEIFGTPESGGVPGPTSAITLVAEMKDSEERRHQFHQKLRAAKEVPLENTAVVTDESTLNLVPNIVRSWMSAESRGYLENILRDGRPAKCREVILKTKPSGSRVPAVMCPLNGHDLVIGLISQQF